MCSWLDSILHPKWEENYNPCLQPAELLVHLNYVHSNMASQLAAFVLRCQVFLYTFCLFMHSNPIIFSWNETWGNSKHLSNILLWSEKFFFPLVGCSSTSLWDFEETQMRKALHLELQAFSFTAGVFFLHLVSPPRWLSGSVYAYHVPAGPGLNPGYVRKGNQCKTYVKTNRVDHTTMVTPKRERLKRKVSMFIGVYIPPQVNVRWFDHISGMGTRYLSSHYSCGL